MASHNASAPIATVAPPSTLTSPSRPGTRHKLTRSTSEFTSPGRLARGKDHARQPSHPRHPHFPLHRKDMSRDDKVPQSAFPTVDRSSLDLSRFDGTGHSRRGSQVVIKPEGIPSLLPNPPDAKAKEEEEEEEEGEDDDDDEEEEQEEEMSREQEKATLRVEGLRKSLLELHSFSSTANKRLDDTYYALLEKTSALKSTVAALKELAETSTDIYGTFEKEARDLETEISMQIDTLGPFDEQEKKIDSLQDRIRDARAMIQSLSNRIEIVRKRVESWEQADKAWQERTRTRLRVIWSVIFVVILAIIVLILSAGPSEPEIGVPETSSLAKSDAARFLDHHRNDSGYPPLAGDDEEDEEEQPLLWREKPAETEDRLRVFDEL